MTVFNKSGLFLSVCLLFAGWLFIGIPASAYEKDFPPYPNGQFPPHCKIHPFKPGHESDRNKGNFKSYYQIDDKGRKLLFELTMNYQKGRSGVYLGLREPAGRIYLDPFKTGVHPMQIGKAYWAYLNKDDIRDFIFTMDVGDGYLSAGRQQAIFLLSTKNGYSARSLGVYHLQPEDFYDYSRDNKCEYLHQAMLLTDGQAYWMYNVLQFIDDRIVIKNPLSRYFPKWIVVTLKPNDKAAKIGAAQKSRLQKLYRKQFRQVLSER